MEGRKTRLCKNQKKYEKDRVWHWFQLVDRKNIEQLIKEALIDIHENFPLTTYNELSKYAHSDYDKVDFLIKEEGLDIFINQDSKIYSYWIYVSTLLMIKTMTLLEKESGKFTFSQNFIEEFIQKQERFGIKHLRNSNQDTLLFLRKC